MKYSVSLLLVALLFPSIALTDNVLVLNGVISKVHDGDSIHLMTKEGRVKIRLAGIDTPEIKQTYGIEARDKLRKLIMDKEVLARCHKIDRYKRQVCIVLLDDQDINLQMIVSGSAWHFKKYQREQSKTNRRKYSDAEDIARRRGIGLWGNKNAIPPWEFRKL